MTIDSVDKIAIGLAASTCQRGVYIKSSAIGGTSAVLYSFWLAAGSIAAGATPGAAAICTSALTGSMPLTPAGGGNQLYLAGFAVATSVASQTIYAVDRLAHCGGLSGILTTAQSVGTDASSLGSRVGASNYSEVAVFLECYTALGISSVTATITYTNGAGTSGQSASVTIPASMGASRMLQFPVVGGCMSVQNITLSASTGTAGNFGVTMARILTCAASAAANTERTMSWAEVGLTPLANNACIFPTMLTSTASTTAIPLFRPVIIEG